MDSSDTATLVSADEMGSVPLLRTYLTSLGGEPLDEFGIVLLDPLTQRWASCISPESAWFSTIYCRPSLNGPDAQGWIISDGCTTVMNLGNLRAAEHTKLCALQHPVSTMGPFPVSASH